MSRHGSPQGPEEHARLADDYPSPDRVRTVVELDERGSYGGDVPTDIEEFTASDATRGEVGGGVSTEGHVDHSIRPDGDGTDGSHEGVIVYGLPNVSSRARELPEEVHHQSTVIISEQSIDDSQSQTIPATATSSSPTPTSSHLPAPPPPPPPPRRPSKIPLSSFYSPTPQDRHSAPIPHAEQITILRDAFARNPIPDKKEMDILAEKTGRSYIKVREYFRQRRNKGKLGSGGDYEGLEEPARAVGWLQSTYRTAPPAQSVGQLSVYSAYKTRFDAFLMVTPLLGGKELIQTILATFPGCRMARQEGEYVVRGLTHREGAKSHLIISGADERVGDVGGISGMDEEDDDDDELRDARDESPGVVALHGDGDGDGARQGGRGGQAHRTYLDTDDLDSVIEPLRATMWLLSEYQSSHSQSTLHPTADSHPATSSHAGAAAHTSIIDVQIDVIQTELYTAYAARFNITPSNPDKEASSHAWSIEGRRRILDPVELIHLVRMTFPSCEPAVDEAGRFIIKGLRSRRVISEGDGMQGTGPLNDLDESNESLSSERRERQERQEQAEQLGPIGQVRQMDHSVQSLQSVHQQYERRGDGEGIFPFALLSGDDHLPTVDDVDTVGNGLERNLGAKRALEQTEGDDRSEEAAKRGRVVGVGLYESEVNSG